MKADSTLDLWMALIIAIPSIIGAVATWHNRKDLKLVKFQVQNSHKANFRDEVTDIGSVVEKLSESIENLRVDVATERHERRESIKEMRTDLHETVKALREDFHDRIETFRKL